MHHLLFTHTLEFTLSRFPLFVLLTLACGAPASGEPDATPPPAPTPAPAPAPRASGVAILDGFEAWSGLNPPLCESPTMDPLTSWCSATRPPDGWKLAGADWGQIAHRGWETYAGKHALSVNSCSYVVEERPPGCNVHVFTGPTFTAAPGRWRLSLHVQRRPDAGFKPPGYTAPMGTRLDVQWLASDCTRALGSARVIVGDASPLAKWETWSESVTAPDDARCARFVLTIEPQPRGVWVDNLELSPE